jgi:FtsP/CotA-like multicopper oxidase with cupredoxin domain
VTNPPDVFSKDGVLRVDLSYNTTTDAFGRTLYCFTTPDGKESPTLHVHPGDRMIINVKNNLPSIADSNSLRMMTSAGIGQCGDAFMSGASVNMHFHGTNTSPTCHSDEVVRTLINPGSTFTYRLTFPKDEPPGLYWYHPHVHGIAEPAVQGGATGAIEVEGIQNLQHAVKKLPQQFLLIRDQNIANPPSFTDPDEPSWDVSLNYVPIPYPNYPPAIIQMTAGQQQFWRVVNSSADTIVDLQLQYDGQPQNLQVVALDGVATGSQDGTRRGTILNMTDILLAPAARAEFIVTPPSSSVKNATMVTLGLDTGPFGDSTPGRQLATIQLVNAKDAAKNAIAHPPLITPDVSEIPGPQRFEGLATATPTAQRTVYFSETPPNPGDPDSLQTFFITVAGAIPTAFDPANPPSIVTNQGAVEDWTIENHAAEVHEFHIHQIHFLLMAKNGVPVPPEQQQFYDMIQVPYYTGTGPYPSVTVRMDFRGSVVGDFVYHCHILGHEDNGMMAIIQVLPRGQKIPTDSLERRSRALINNSIAWCRRRK